MDARIGVCDHRPLAGLTGLLHVSRLGTATGQVASGLEFSSIAAVVIGGTSLSGGRGTFIGSLIGVIFISVIGNELVLMGVHSQAQNVVRILFVYNYSRIPNSSNWPIAAGRWSICK